MAGLEDLYREIILDHYRSPRNKGELETPPATKVEGYNPLCGDEIVLYLQVDGGTVTDVKIGGQGCSISQSSASMMSAAIKGKSVAEVRGARPGVQGADVDPRDVASAATAKTTDRGASTPTSSSVTSRRCRAW